MGLVLLFVVVPAVELYLLIQVGSAIGAAATVALIVVTGVLGASMARNQGFRVVAGIQQELAEGRLPASAMLDGLMILVAGALLITPGILTDIVGFLCLVPAFRSLLKTQILRRLETAIAEQRIRVHVEGAAFGAQPRPPFEGPGQIIDLEARREDSGTRRNGD